MAKGLSLRRASVVGKFEQVKQPRDEGFSAARPAELLDQVEHNVGGWVRQRAEHLADRRRRGHRPGVKPLAHQAVDHRAGHLGDVGLGGGIGVTRGKQRGIEQDRDLDPAMFHKRPTLAKLAWSIRRIRSA